MSPDVLVLLALEEDVSADELAHLETCTNCRAELDELRRTVSLGRSIAGGDTLQEPPQRVWEAIRADLGLGTDSPATPTAAPAEPLPTADPAATPPDADLPAVTEPGHASWGVGERAPGPKRWLALTLAAALALIAGIGIGLGIDRARQSTETVIRTAQLQAFPNWPGSTGIARVERDASGNLELIVELSSPEPTDGRRQVWLIDAETKVMSSLGFLRRDGTGQWPIPPSLDLAEYPVVDVSDEPPDDDNPLHSGNSIVRGTLS